VGRPPLWLLAPALLVALAGPLPGKTLTLTAEDCDQMAVLNAKAPRASWAAILAAEGTYNIESQLQLFPDMAVLLRFPLEAIPPDQRITRAQLTIACEYVAGTPEVSVRRLLADWGHGVCHLYRTTYPKKVEWNKPGGRGASTDRAAKDSAVFKIAAVGEHTVDVTEDIDLWYTGAVANRGWILAIENESGPAYFAAPYSPHLGSGKKWKLQITFEPK
jgi:hypothetical protein